MTGIIQGKNIPSAPMTAPAAIKTSPVLPVMWLPGVMNPNVPAGPIPEAAGKEAAHQAKNPKPDPALVNQPVIPSNAIRTHHAAEEVGAEVAAEEVGAEVEADPPIYTLTPIRLIWAVR